MLGAFKASTTTGKMIRTTANLTHQMLSLFRKRSFDAVDTIADWKLSNAAVLRETTITSTIPTVLDPKNQINMLNNVSGSETVSADRSAPESS